MSKTYTRQGFIEDFGLFILNQTKGTGIFPETLISQAILESQGIGSDGKYYVGGSKLSKEANNLFGIKANRWKGKTYNIDTGEVLNGRKVVVNANFRVYNTVKDSIKDYIKFLQENPRYKDALQSVDYSTQNKRLQSAGYATGSNYADTLNSVIKPLLPIIDNERKKLKKRNTLKVAGYSTAMLIVVILTVSVFRKKN